MKRVLAGGLAVAFLAAVGCGGASSTAPKMSSDDLKNKYEGGAAGGAMKDKMKAETGTAPTGSK